jgi:hypothetical protein
LLSTNENAKVAAKLIADWKMDINNFPEVKERLMKACMRYYLGRYLYKKPGEKDYMSIDHIDDLFDGSLTMLAYLTDELAYKGKLNDAKGILLKHHLDEYIRADTTEKLKDHVYNADATPPFEDYFGPYS